MRVLVVLPTYREAATIAAVAGSLRGLGRRPDVLVVDDASPDGTAAVVTGAFGDDDGVALLQRPAKAGLGSAYRDGFRWGLDRDYDVIVEMDADGSHAAADVPRLVDALAAGADLVVGTRYAPGGSIPEWTPWRRGLSRWGNRYAIAVLRLPTTDATSGLRAYRADLLRAIGADAITADGYAFQIAGTYLAARAGGTVGEVPIRFAERSDGASKMSPRIILEALALVTWWGLRDRLRARLGSRNGVSSPASPRGTRPRR